MKQVLVVLVVIALMAGISALAALIVAFAYNQIMPPLFGWHPITIWQAYLAMVLLNIIGGLLFKKDDKK